jgi:hypothetical protein
MIFLSAKIHMRKSAIESVGRFSEDRSWQSSLDVSDRVT